MTSKNSITEFLEKKEVRIAIAVLCSYFAINSLYELLTATGRNELLHGGGGVLIWGGWALVNGLKPFGKSIPGINIAINIGLVLLVASWVVK